MNYLSYFLARYGVRTAVIFALIFFAIQPFNSFCLTTQKCQPFYFSDLLPKKEGKIHIPITFETVSYQREVEFYVKEPIITTVANKKTSAVFLLKNNSAKSVTVKPRMTIVPDFAKSYFKRYQCICGNSYKIKAGEMLELKITFEFDQDLLEKYARASKEGDNWQVTLPRILFSI